MNDILEKIAQYNPSKVFVEWPYNEQVQLDSLYDLYLENIYFKNDDLNDFYKKNEIFQLAFRSAKTIGLDKVHAIDYNKTDFPFDSLMTVINQSSQLKLQEIIKNSINRFTIEFDDKIPEGTSLKELIYHTNSKEFRKLSNEFHNQVPLLVGGGDNFIGPHLTSEWYKRNLYMWSLIQKKTSSSDERIMILLGASHVAIIEDFINKTNNWTTVELKDVIDKL